MELGSILVVDDEVMMRDVIKEMLSDKVSKITTAESGSQALKILSRNRFDIILTDMKMPDMNGLQLMEYAKFIDPMIPLIVMTAYSDIYDLREAIAKGAEEYIVKPFRKEDLEIAINKVLLRSLSKRSKILLKYVATANSLIARSNDTDKEELVAIGKRLINYWSAFYPQKCFLHCLLQVVDEKGAPKPPTQ